MTIELSNIKLVGSSAFVQSVSDNPILLSTDIAGTIQIVDRIRVEPEVGDWQIIAGVPMVWDGSSWVKRNRAGNYDPISFLPPNGEDIWTVYPGWKAMLGQVVYCHRCFAAEVSVSGSMDGWWVTPNHTDRLTCMMCGQTIGQHLGRMHQTGFVRKARKGF